MTTIKAERMARDLDTMVNVVNSDPGHIARAKAKRAKVLAQEEKREDARIENIGLRIISGFCIWALTLVALV